MELSYVVDSLDGVDEGMRGLYAEKDGKFELKVKGLNDAFVPKSDFVRERESRRAAEERAKKALSDDDLKEFESLKTLADKGRNTDDILTRWNKKKEQDDAAKDAETARWKQDAIDVRREQAAAALIAKHKGNYKILIDQVLKQISVEDVAGKLTAVPTQAASLDDVILSFKKDPDFAVAFADSGHSGSGATGGHAGAGGAKTMTRAQFDALDSTAKHAHYSAGGKVTD